MGLFNNETSPEDLEAFEKVEEFLRSFGVSLRTNNDLSREMGVRGANNICVFLLLLEWSRHTVNVPPVQIYHRLIK